MQSTVFKKVRTAPWGQAEAVLFLIVLFLNLGPVFSTGIFSTLDGPAHVYNSNIINQLLFDPDTVYRQYFQLNPDVLIPNWIGHVLLSLLNSVLPGVLAEKLVVSIYLLLLPLAFRYFVKAVNPANTLFSYIIFPFTYTLFFLMGFYNFSFGLVGLFFALGYALNNREELHRPKKAVFLFALLMLTYFSHLVLFLLLLLLLASWFASTLFIKWLNRKQEAFTWKPQVRRALVLAAVASPGLLLSLLFFMNRPTIPGGETFLPRAELLSWLKNLRPLIAYCFPREEPYTRLLVYLLGGLILLTIGLRIRTILKMKFKNILQPVDFVLPVALLMLVLFFIMPDSQNGVGMISIRYCYLFFILLFTWVLTQQLSKLFFWPVVAVILYSHFNLNAYYTEVLRFNNTIAIETARAADFIVPGSTVVPFNLREWNFGHTFGYVGIDKPIVVLENYECDGTHFPVNWNNETLPDVRIGSLHNTSLPGYYWKSVNGNKIIPADFVFIIGKLEHVNDTAGMHLRREITANYHLKYAAEAVELYERNELK